MGKTQKQHSFPSNFLRSFPHVLIASFKWLRQEASKSRTVNAAIFATVSSSLAQFRNNPRFTINRFRQRTSRLRIRARAGFKGKPNLLAKRLCSDRQRIDKSSLNSFCQRTVTKPSFILASIDGEREVGPTLCRGIARIIYDAEKPVINGVACITSF